MCTSHLHHEPHKRANNNPFTAQSKPYTPDRVFNDQHDKVVLHTDFGSSYGKSHIAETGSSDYYHAPQNLTDGQDKHSETAEPVRDSLYAHKSVRFWNDVGFFLELYHCNHLSDASLTGGVLKDQVIGTNLGFVF